MAITKVQQLQISGTLASRVSDSVSNGNLLKANRTIEDDLNSLRTQVKLIMGTSAWTDNLSGSQDLADIYAGLRVTPTTGTSAFQGAVYTAGDVNVSGSIVTAGDVTVGGNDIRASDGNANITLTSNTLTTFAGDIKVTGNDIQASDGNTNITMTSNTLTTFAGDVKIGGNDIQASDGATALTLSATTGDVAVAGDLTVTGNDIKSSGGVTAITFDGAQVQTAGDLRVVGNDISGSAGLNITLGSSGDITVAGDVTVGGNDIKASDGNTNITMTSNTLTEIKGDLQVTGNDIKSSTGGTAITLSGADVTFPGSAVVSGDLTVNGTMTTVNSVNLEIKDAVIGLGFASGTVQQASGDRGWIGGLAGSNNVAAFWDDSATEFAFATTTNSATGSLPIPIVAYSNIRAAEVSGSIVKASLGLSGSLTRLTDGTSAFIAGTNVTITSASNGAVTINATSTVSAPTNAQYLTLATNGTLTDERVFTPGTGLSATDGGANGNYTLSINDSVVATVSGTTFQGTIKPSQNNFYDLGSTGTRWYRGYIDQISGSHTQLVDGTSAFIAGSGIQITTGSNGAVTIANIAAITDTVKGYLLGNSPYINTGNGEITFGSGGAGFGTLNNASDEYIDVYLNGVYLAFGYDITNIGGNKVTLDTSITSTLTSDDIISITLRDIT